MLHASAHIQEIRERFTETALPVDADCVGALSLTLARERGFEPQRSGHLTVGRLSLAVADRFLASVPWHQR